MRSPQSSPCDSHNGLPAAPELLHGRQLHAQGLIGDPLFGRPEDRGCPAEVYQLVLQKGDVEGTNGVAFGSRDRKQPEGTSDGYDRRRGASEAAAIPIDCSGVVIVSTERCDRIR